MTKAFFTTEDGKWFSPTEFSRGPWHIDHCHAGPPSGLAARAMERLQPHKRLTRLTVDLIRPVPHAGFRVAAKLTRKGRTVSTASGSIIDGKGTVCATFNGMLMARAPSRELPTHHCDIGDPNKATAGHFAIKSASHGKTCFVHAVEMRYPQGETPTPGPTSLWMKTVPLLDTEKASPFQRICPLADCGNAFGRNADSWNSITFANTDLTLVLHREPEGEWLGAHAVSYWEADGIGMAESQLFDKYGSVGRSLQTLVLRAKKSR